MLQAYPLLNLMGNLALAVEALTQARIAKTLIAERGETQHLVGKLLNLDFYVANILPMATAISKAIQSGNDVALDRRLFA
jgi:hypothetical protein